MTGYTSEKCIFLNIVALFWPFGLEIHFWEPLTCLSSIIFPFDRSHLHSFFFTVHGRIVIGKDVSSKFFYFSNANLGQSEGCVGQTFATTAWMRWAHWKPCLQFGTVTISFPTSKRSSSPHLDSQFPTTWKHCEEIRWWEMTKTDVHYMK